MDLYNITGDRLFSSVHKTLRKALGEAVIKGVCLQGIDLRRARLSGARLDGLDAPGACLWGADLSGCDMADANLVGADARLATLTDACLADARCAGVQFDGAYFKNTLVDGADFSDCRFSCPSILSMPLHLCRALRGSVYWHRGEVPCPLDGGIMRLQVLGNEIIALGEECLIVNGIFQAPRGRKSNFLQL
jgi:hypothetical protein